MGVFNANWEDEENNRVVELAVQYRRNDTGLEVVEVTPASVTFLDPQSKHACRKIRVCTPAGRSLLLKAYQNKVGLDRLHEELNDAVASSC